MKYFIVNSRGIITHQLHEELNLDDLRRVAKENDEVIIDKNCRNIETGEKVKTIGCLDWNFECSRRCNACDNIEDNAGYRGVSTEQYIKDMIEYYKNTGKELVEL